MLLAATDMFANGKLGTICAFYPPETGITLAKEYVEHAVIEEDVAALLKYMRRYYDLVDVVEYGMGKIEAFLGEDGTNLT